MMSRTMKVKIVCAAILSVTVLLMGAFWYFRVYDDFMQGTMDAEFGHSQEASAALEDFSKMLKPAFIVMLKDAVHTRLTTGEWPSADPAEEGTDT